MRADARRNREKLFQAARDVFAENPQEVGMDAIAERAGVGIATLFRNFPRRIDLIEALYREEIVKLQILADELHETREPWDALAEWLRAFVVFAGGKRTIFAELAAAFDKDPEFSEASYKQVDAAISTVFGPAQAAGEVRDDLTTADLIQLVGGMAISVVSNPARNDYLLEIILEGIRLPGK